MSNRTDDGLGMKRETIWRQLIDAPHRDVHTIVLVCAEQGVDTDADYVQAIRARWRNTLSVLQEAGCKVPA